MTKTNMNNELKSKELAFYKNLEIERRLIILPCKVGDMVNMICTINDCGSVLPYHQNYSYSDLVIKTTKILSFTIEKNTVRAITDINLGWTMDMWNKTVFDTYEKAVTALSSQKYLIDY